MSLTEMGVNDIVNYVIFDNPVSKSVVKPVLKWSGIATSSPKPVTIITESKPLWELALQQGPFIRIAGLMGASAVALGAYGAHKSYPKESADELKSVFETGNRFHFLHSLTMLGVPLCRRPVISGSLIITGTVLFSGACYYHAFTGENKLGKLAPVGGTILIFGWLAMVL